MNHQMGFNPSRDKEKQASNKTLLLWSRYQQHNDVGSPADVLIKLMGYLCDGGGGGGGGGEPV